LDSINLSNLQGEKSMVSNLFPVSGKIVLVLKRLEHICVEIKEAKVGEICFQFSDYEHSTYFEIVQNYKTFIIKNKSIPVPKTTSSFPKTNPPQGDRSVPIGGSSEGSTINTGDGNVFTQIGKYNVNADYLSGLSIGDNYFKGGVVEETLKPENITITIFVPPGTELNVQETFVEAEEVQLGDIKIENSGSKTAKLLNVKGVVYAHVSDNSKAWIKGAFTQFFATVDNFSFLSTNGIVTEKFKIRVGQTANMQHRHEIRVVIEKEGLGKLTYI
jgi:hypothetical protein